MKIQEKSVKLNPNYVKINILKKIKQEEFLGGPAVKDWFSNAEGTGSIPGGETKIPHAIRHGQINKQEKKKNPGWEGGNICTHIAASLHCTAETNIILQSNYTPIKKERKKSRNPHTSGTFPSSGGWGKESQQGPTTANSSLSKCPSLSMSLRSQTCKGRAARLSGGRYLGFPQAGRACVVAGTPTRTHILTAHPG